MKTINVLAVNDPAVNVYVDTSKGFLKRIENKLGINIDFEIVPFDSYYDTLMESFDNDKIDIVMVAGHLWLPAFVQNNYLSALYTREESKVDKDILKSIREEMYYEDKQYLMPSFCDGHLLTYRKSYLDRSIASKVSLNKIIEHIKNLNRNNDIYPIVLKSHPTEIFLDVLPYLRAAGCEPFTDLGKPQFNNDMAVEGIKNYLEMIKYAPKDTLLFDNDRVREAIQNRESIFAVTWGGQMGAVMDEECKDRDDVGFAILDESWNVTWSFGINNNSNSKELALKVMEELTAKDIDIEVGRICGNPTRYSSFTEDDNKYPWYSLAKEMIESSKPLPSFPLLSDFIGIFSKFMTEIANGRMEIMDALNEATDEMNRLQNSGSGGN
ncbi:extracellular solute-binding protein [Paramaledivibacter caminithermalis]|uniref:Multiple sugar transport system substrate-binding protein n=1 Tax=Paramaledivibacter caminithermalis (strain DSM 15212 / CIP 107654 / DViRD3) TaxID=1121301 RepID=A0A1M6P4H2_PARC5|nr:extracellular solute-binding protein [Paramaledivibacter caminithermalis]SHK02796.1 multiple sugar transport system substrate-binding protein [Paramaledivibacter caminithermalis DSM 15212]